MTMNKLRHMVSEEFTKCQERTGTITMSLRHDAVGTKQSLKK